MAEAAESPELQQAFTKHLKETEAQVQRLEMIFQHLGQVVRGKQCKGLQGILEEGKETLEKDNDASVLDAAVIASAQKVEHYEIATYGCLRTYAQLLGHTRAVKLLEQTLSEQPFPRAATLSSREPMTASITASQLQVPLRSSGKRVPL
jgi:ferritin-like metal-binding protein YciE